MLILLGFFLALFMPLFIMFGIPMTYGDYVSKDMLKDYDGYPLYLNSYQEDYTE